MYNGIQNLCFLRKQAEFIPSAVMAMLAKYIENSSKKIYNESGDKFGNKLQQK